MENNLLDSGVSVDTDMFVKEDHLAGRGQRFLNYLIDGIILYVLMIGADLLLFSQSNASAGLLTYAVNIGVMILYYTILESTTGKTIGKFATQTRVVEDDFSKPSVKTIFLRSLCRCIPFEAFSFFGNPPAGWHDTIVGVNVVKDEK
jgi:uncharacterized RDD family membrane protein YckC